MASRLIAQRTCTLLPRNLIPTPAVRSTASLSRPFTTDNTSQVSNIRNDDSGSVEIDRRHSSDRASSVARRPDYSPNPLSGWVDPFSPTRTLSHVFNLMDQLMDPFFQTTSTRGAPSTRRGWDVKEDENNLYLRLDMPGLSKEDVKVCAEQNTLVIKGEGGKESEDDEGRKYSSRIELPPHLYKLDEIRGEMKSGVLKIIVPKVRDEQRMHVKEIPVE